VSSNTSGDNDGGFRQGAPAMGTQKKSRTALGRRIRQAREGMAAGGTPVSLTRFAQMLSVTRGAVSQWELGIVEPSAENLRNIALKANVNFDWLATGRGAHSTLSTKPDMPFTQQTMYARVVGEIGGGGWFENSLAGLSPDLPPDFDKYEPVPVVRSRKYNGVEQFALKVVGPSVNKLIKDGDFAVCVPYFEARSAPLDGDVVAVERTRGGLHQGTIKRLRRVGKIWELHPESTDPKHQQPIRLTENLTGDRDDAGTQIVIIGLVVGHYGQI
jgi:transcriptional regulator with XRE-family HTH domain